MKTKFILWAFCMPFYCFSQFTETFDDGDFTHSPAWAGAVEQFIISNSTLQSNASSASSSYLFTPSSALENAEWYSKIKINYSTSSMNYAELILLSDTMEIINGFNGYFVQAGGSKDEICLYAQKGTNKTKIIDGIDKRTDGNPVELLIKVTRDSLANFRLYSMKPTESEYYFEGETQDNEITEGKYFGLGFTNSASTGKAYSFDDVLVTGRKVTRIPDADSASLVFNEIMYEPADSSAEFIEIYNRSANKIYLQGMSIATLKDDGTLSSKKNISQNIWLLPGEYVVITEDSLKLKRFHPCIEGLKIVQTNWSSLNNTGAKLAILNRQGAILDITSYSPEMHLKSYEETKGVSLEKINENLPSDLNMSWISAGITSCGRCSPGFRNSQWTNDDNPIQVAGTFEIEPFKISPDGDGNDDVCILSYVTDNPADIGRIRIFNAQGEVVRNLTGVFVSGTNCKVVWNCADDQGKQLGQGIYIAYLELFNAKTGKVSSFKHLILLAGV